MNYQGYMPQGPPNQTGQPYAQTNYTHPRGPQMNHHPMQHNMYASHAHHTGSPVGLNGHGHSQTAHEPPNGAGILFAGQTTTPPQLPPPPSFADMGMASHPNSATRRAQCRVRTARGGNNSLQQQRQQQLHAQTQPQQLYQQGMSHHAAHGHGHMPHPGHRRIMPPPAPGGVVVNRGHMGDKGTDPLGELGNAVMRMPNKRRVPPSHPHASMTRPGDGRLLQSHQMNGAAFKMGRPPVPPPPPNGHRHNRMHAQAQTRANENPMNMAQQSRGMHGPPVTRVAPTSPRRARVAKPNNRYGVQPSIPNIRGFVHQQQQAFPSQPSSTPPKSNEVVPGSSTSSQTLAFATTPVPPTPPRAPPPPRRPTRRNSRRANTLKGRRASPPKRPIVQVKQIAHSRKPTKQPPRQQRPVKPAVQLIRRQMNAMHFQPTHNNKPKETKMDDSNGFARMSKLVGASKENSQQICESIRNDSCASGRHKTVPLRFDAVRRCVCGDENADADSVDAKNFVAMETRGPSAEKLFPVGPKDAHEDARTDDVEMTDFGANLADGRASYRPLNRTHLNVKQQALVSQLFEPGDRRNNPSVRQGNYLSDALVGACTKLKLGSDVRDLLGESSLVKRRGTKRSFAEMNGGIMSRFSKRPRLLSLRDVMTAAEETKVDDKSQVKGKSKRRQKKLTNGVACGKVKVISLEDDDDDVVIVDIDKGGKDKKKFKAKTKIKTKMKGDEVKEADDSVQRLQFQHELVNDRACVNLQAVNAMGSVKFEKPVFFNDFLDGVPPKIEKNYIVDCQDFVSKRQPSEPKKTDEKSIQTDNKTTKTESAPNMPTLPSLAEAKEEERKAQGTPQPPVKPPSPSVRSPAAATASQAAASQSQQQPNQQQGQGQQPHKGQVVSASQGLAQGTILQDDRGQLFTIAHTPYMLNAQQQQYYAMQQHFIQQQQRQYAAAYGNVGQGNVMMNNNMQPMMYSYGAYGQHGAMAARQGSHMGMAAGAQGSLPNANGQFIPQLDMKNSKFGGKKKGVKRASNKKRRDNSSESESKRSKKRMKRSMDDDSSVGEEASPFPRKNVKRRRTGDMSSLTMDAHEQEAWKRYRKTVDIAQGFEMGDVTQVTANVTQVPKHSLTGISDVERKSYRDSLFADLECKTLSEDALLGQVEERLIRPGLHGLKTTRQRNLKWSQSGHDDWTQTEYDKTLRPNMTRIRSKDVRVYIEEDESEEELDEDPNDSDYVCSDDEMFGYGKKKRKIVPLKDFDECIFANATDTYERGLCYCGEETSTFDSIRRCGVCQIGYHVECLHIPVKALIDRAKLSDNEWMCRECTSRLTHRIRVDTDQRAYFVSFYPEKLSGRVRQARMKNRKVDTIRAKGKRSVMNKPQNIKILEFNRIFAANGRSYRMRPFRNFDMDVLMKLEVEMSHELMGEKGNTYSRDFLWFRAKPARKDFKCWRTVTVCPLSADATDEEKNVLCEDTSDTRPREEEDPVGFMLYHYSPAVKGHDIAARARRRRCVAEGGTRSSRKRLHLARTRAVSARNGFIELFWILTHKQHRRIGIATRLIEHLIEFGRTEFSHVSEVRLHCLTNNVKGKNLYQKLGFVAELEKGKYPSTGFNSLRFVKSL